MTMASKTMNHQERENIWRAKAKPQQTFGSFAEEGSALQATRNWNTTPNQQGYYIKVKVSTPN
jgi:hypothetical protein